MILIDYKDRRPIYEQIVEKFQQMIICGNGTRFSYALCQKSGNGIIYQSKYNSTCISGIGEGRIYLYHEREGELCQRIK